MKLVKPGYEILTDDETINGMMRRMELAGRTCYKSESANEKGDLNKTAEFMKMILDRGHLTVTEHESISVRIICDRGVTHEIVRHRIASYSQESTRYCNYSGGVAFIIPPWIENLGPGDYSEEDGCGLANDVDMEWFFTMQTLEKAYMELLRLGWSPQQARSVLPNSLKTEIVMTANLREWKHFFMLRCAPAAHPQMREIAIPMLKAFYGKLPVIFEKEMLQFS